MVDHVTVWRWVQRYAPELARQLRRRLKPTNDSWRVDETYIRVKGKWVYLYRAVDSSGATIDFLLSAKRDAAAAKRFLAKSLAGENHPAPRVINTDHHAGYPQVIAQLKAEGATKLQHIALRHVGTASPSESRTDDSTGQSIHKHTSAKAVDCRSPKRIKLYKCEDYPRARNRKRFTLFACACCQSNSGAQCCSSAPSQCAFLPFRLLAEALSGVLIRSRLQSQPVGTTLPAEPRVTVRRPVQ